LKSNARPYSTGPAIHSHDDRNPRISNIIGPSCQGNLHQFFIKPDIYVEHHDSDQDRFFPIQRIDGMTERRYLRVNIVNRGRGVATDCVAKLRLIGWQKNVRHPLTEPKILSWSDGSEKKDYLSSWRRRVTEYSIY
jgi:hypothetical protein